MVAREGFAEFLREQLAPLGHIALRCMFGKTGVFCDGVMLAISYPVALTGETGDAHSAEVIE